MVSRLLLRSDMKRSNLIAVRQLRAADRFVRVELFQNEGSSVAARCLLDPNDTPIIDAPSIDEALAAVEDVLDGLLLARRRPERLTGT